jgi:hypothetical protein
MAGVMPPEAIGLGLAELMVVAAVALVVVVPVVVLVLVLTKASRRARQSTPMIGRPAGWYDDPVSPGMITYWNGREWDWSSRAPANTSQNR